MGKFKDNIAVIMVILGLIGSTGAFYSKFAKMELTIQNLSAATAPDLSGIESNGFAILDNSTEIKILNKELELIKLQLREFKAQSSNPLGG
tara:strand:+ start:138 stop:410 length:273 start_codon:yes stop_codon:yes gene_type:complete